MHQKLQIYITVKKKAKKRKRESINLQITFTKKVVNK
jgi:hypothetical protein